MVWAKAFGGPNDDDLQAITIRDDRVFIAGAFTGGVEFQGMVFTSSIMNLCVLELSTDGELRWGYTIPSKVAQVAGTIRVAADYRIFLAAASLANPKIDAELYSLSPDRQTLSARPLPTALYNGNVNVSLQGIVLDGTGGIVVGGYFADTVDFGGGPRTANGSQDGFAAAYTATLDYRWSTLVGGPGYDDISGIALLSADHAVVGGGFRGTMQVFHGVGYYNMAYGLAIDNDNTVGVGAFSNVTNPGGHFLASTGGMDGFVVKWSGWPP